MGLPTTFGMRMPEREHNEAAEDDGYEQDKLDPLEKDSLKVFVISNHPKGQTVCDDQIDERHPCILPDRIVGAREAVEFVRRLGFDWASAAFDTACSS